MKIYRSLILTSCILLSSFVYASENILRERVYVQTDKQLYIAGELIWVKLITTDINGVPLNLSKVGYVELIGEEGSPKVQAKIEIENGIGEGFLLLPTALATDNYCLVAYTRYMLNEGEGSFFSKIVPVINTFTLDKPVNKIADSTLTVSPHATDGTLQLKADRAVYPTRTKGEIQIQGLPHNIHTLSIAIAGYQPNVKVEDFGIALWNSRLQAQHKPAFDGSTLPEYEGHIVEGKIIDLAAKQPTAEGELFPLLSFQGDQIRLFIGHQKGENVTYYTKRIRGMHDVSTSAHSLSSARYRIDILSPFFQHSNPTLPTLEINTVWNDLLLRRSIGLQALNAYTADSLSLLEYDNALFQWKPTKKYVLDHYNRFDTMEETIAEFIMELRFRRINGKRFLLVAEAENVLSFSVGNSLVMLDGIPIVDHESIYSYNPRLVKEIDVYTGRYVLGAKIFDGLVSFRTFNNDYPELVVGEETQIFQYEGTQAHRRFYTPSYDVKEEESSRRIPDFRHTLLWNPSIEIQGQSIATVPFTTSDLTGDFIATVEGITKDGKVVSAEVLIKVE